MSGLVTGLPANKMLARIVWTVTILASCAVLSLTSLNIVRPVKCNGQGSSCRAAPGCSNAACLHSNGRSESRCRLPPVPKNGRYHSLLCDFGNTSTACGNLIDNSVPNGFILHYQCDYGFSLKGKTDIFCASGNWHPRLPTCSDKCEPVSSKKLKISCTRRKERISCENPLPSRVKLVFECNSGTAVQIKQQAYSEITCRNGQWDRPLVDDFCKEDCGRATTYADLPLDSTGDFSRFPWQAGVYQLTTATSSWEQKCGGSLVSDKVVVSAAQCFSDRTNGRKYSDLEKYFKVALGKYHGQLYDNADQYVQVYDVKTVRFPAGYLGEYRNLVNDIAVVILDKPVKFNHAVKPICLDDAGENLEEAQLVDGARAELPGWGLSLKMKGGNSLKFADMTLVPNDRCLDKSSNSSRKYLTGDKLCMEDVRSDVTLCPNDNGGGLVFQDFGTYYLRGVLSMALDRCRNHEFAYFTKISKHRDLIEFSTECKLPPAPPHGSYNVYYTDIYDNTTAKKVRTLSFTCQEGFSMIGKSNTVRCQDGDWYPDVPTCSDKCSPLSSKILYIECFDSVKSAVNCSSPMSEGSTAIFSCNPRTHVMSYEPQYSNMTCQNSRWDRGLLQDFCIERSSVVNRRKDVCLPLSSVKLFLVCVSADNQQLDCSSSVPNGTKAYFRCFAPGYVNFAPLPYKSITCINGEWSKLLPEEACQPNCGEILSNKADPFIGTGTVPEHGEFPWHAALFEYENQTDLWELICGGSIISPKVIITAAHCVATVDSDSRLKKNKPVANLLVEVGKYHRDMNAASDKDKQQRRLEAVYTPETYLGHLTLLKEDIGFLILAAPLIYDAYVRPVCLDVGMQSFENQQLVNGAVGKVAGWGKTEEGVGSQVLRVAEMPYVTDDVCRRTISQDLISRLDPGKFCAGNQSSATTVCSGDSGGGLVFYNSEQNKYYLRGIVSQGVKKCKGKEYAIFTRISSYDRMVEYFLHMENFDSKALNSASWH